MPLTRVTSNLIGSIVLGHVRNGHANQPGAGAVFVVPVCLWEEVSPVTSGQLCLFLGGGVPCDFRSVVPVSGRRCPL